MKNRDWSVVCTAGISLVISSLVVFSTGLITLLPTEIEETTSMKITSTFVDSVEQLSRPIAIASFRRLYPADTYNLLSHPLGVSEQYAYQSIDANGSDYTWMEATVEALSTGLDCLEGSIAVVFVGGVSRTNGTILDLDTFLDIRELGFHVDDHVFPFALLRLSTPECTVFLPVVLSRGLGSPVEESFTVGRLQRAGCGNSSAPDDQRLVILVGTVNTAISTGPPDRSEKRPEEYSFSESARFLCKPTSVIKQVKLGSNGMGLPGVSALRSSAVRRLENVHAWDITNAYFSATDPGFNSPMAPSSYIMMMEAYNTSNLTIESVNYMFFAIFDTSIETHRRYTTSYKEALLDSLLAFHQQFSALVAHLYLFEPSQIQGTATIWRSHLRLVVRPLAAHLMAVLLVISSLLTLSILATALDGGCLPKAPGTILRTAALLCGDHQSTTILRHLSLPPSILRRNQIGQAFYRCWASQPSGPNGSDVRHFGIHESQRLHQSLSSGKEDCHCRAFKTYRPVVIHPISRVAVLCTSVGFVVAIQLTLRNSQLREGLGDIQNETYLHYLWTSVPAIALSLFALSLSATDAETRALTPYINLAQPTSLDRSLTLDLLDGLAPTLGFRQLRSRSIGSFIISMAYLIGTMFTVFAGSLFVARSSPDVWSIDLQASSSFKPFEMGSATGRDWIQAVARIEQLLWANTSFPVQSYYDLVFPVVNLTGGNSHSQPLYSPSQGIPDVQIRATIPALRPRLHCRSYGARDIGADVFVNHTRKASIRVLGEICIGMDVNESFEMDPMSNYFALIARESCSDYLFIWGTYNLSGSSDVVTALAMGCNETVEIVDTEVRLSGPDLGLHADFAPVPLDHTARALATLKRSRLELLAYLDTPLRNHITFDGFFAALTTSRWAIPESYLKDISKRPEVEGAVKTLLPILRAQWMNLVQRHPANSTNATVHGADHKTDSEMIYPAILV